MNNENQFDELLQEALSEYRDAEPLAGLEGRILQRLQAQPTGRRSLWWIRGAIAASVALVFIGIWIGGKKPTPPKDGGVGHPAPLTAASQPAYPGPDLPLPQTRADSSPATHKVHKPASGAGRVGMPAQTLPEARAAVFPLPSPLTPEERAFLAALQKGTDALPTASTPEAAITIAEIEIKPLVVVGVSSSENPGEKQ
jgi:hypothetical protein